MACSRKKSFRKLKGSCCPSRYLYVSHKTEQPVEKVPGGRWGAHRDGQLRLHQGGRGCPRWKTCRGWYADSPFFNSCSWPGGPPPGDENPGRRGYAWTPT